MNEVDVIWRRGDSTMPRKAECVVKAAQAELLLKSLSLPFDVVNAIRYNASKNSQTINDYISAIVVNHQLSVTS